MKVLLQSAPLVVFLTLSSASLYQLRKAAMLVQGAIVRRAGVPSPT